MYEIIGYQPRWPEEFQVLGSAIVVALGQCLNAPRISRAPRAHSAQSSLRVPVF